jgi:hypothetical protein
MLYPERRYYLKYRHGWRGFQKALEYVALCEVQSNTTVGTPVDAVDILARFFVKLHLDADLIRKIGWEASHLDSPCSGDLLR